MNLSALMRQHLKPLLSFGVIGGIGVAINMAILYLLYSVFTTPLWLATAIAIEAAIIANFLGNYFFTFKDQKDHALTKFLRFQSVSLVTAAIAWAIVNGLAYFFGSEPEWIVYLFNLVAIGIGFIANYALNVRYTWNVERPAALLIAAVLVMGFAMSEVSAATEVSVSQLGFHPDGIKEAIVYSPDDSESFEVVTVPGGAVALSGSLTEAIDWEGDAVDCHSGRECRIADFTALEAEGTYRIVTDEGVQSLTFRINDDIYSSNIGVFSEYYNAMLQEGSDYHAPFHRMHNTGDSPTFPAMADGSYILEASQAAIPAIRLSEAYVANPELLSVDTFDLYGSGLPDVAEQVLSYVEFLESVQGVVLEYRTDGVGFRTNENLKAQNYFTPGPIADANTTDELFVACNPIDASCTAVEAGENEDTPYVTGVQVIDTGLVLTTICGDIEGTAYDSCVDFAAEFYKCQENEVCLNLSYIEDTALLIGHSGYEVSTGWYYEFGCDLDVILDESFFNDNYNPCMIFDEETTLSNTAYAFHAYVASVPVIHAIDQTKSQEVYERAIATYENALEDDLSRADTDSLAHIGAGLFKLYALNGDVQYLEDAASLADSITSIDDSAFWDTNGAEFYWSAYLAHADDAAALGIDYPIDTQSVRNSFRGKLYYDHWTGNSYAPNSVSGNAERVVTKFRNWGYLNSRAQLIVAVLAERAIGFGVSDPGDDTYVQMSESQIGWVTGKNLIQEGQSGSDFRSYSFIYGIGESINPTQQHTRYYIDTGHRLESGGQVIGARGTSLLHYNGTQYRYLDGRAEILGYVLGANGNGYDGEVQNDKWDTSKEYLNGRTTIPGWVSGAFDIESDTDPDDFFNYVDDVNIYEFTEATNEGVAVAVELFALQDARLNNRAALEIPTFPLGTVSEASVTFIVEPVPATVILSRNNAIIEIDVDGLESTSVPAGSYAIAVEAVGYETQTEASVLFEEGESYTLSYTLEPSSEMLYDVSIASQPDANVTFGNEATTTPATFRVPAGNHTLLLEAFGYDPFSTIVEVTGTTSLSYVLNTTTTDRHSITITSDPESNVTIGSTTLESPAVFELVTGKYTVMLRAYGYETRIDQISVIGAETFSYTLDEIASGSLYDVTIDSEPPSNVTIGSLTKETPAVFGLENGTYDIVLEAVGYEALTTEIVVNGSRTFDFELNESSGGSVYDVTITSVPESNVTIGSLTKETPAVFGLENGTYDVTLRADGYESLTAEILVNGTGTFDFELNETASGAIYNVSITSDPESNVTIGSLTKASPAVFSLQAGTYDVVLEAAGYETLMTSIVVDGNENRSFVLTQRPEDNVMIIDDATNLEEQRKEGTIYETIPVNFSVGTNDSTNVTWTVTSAESVLETTKLSSEENFTYAAPILFSRGTGSVRNVVVTATVPGDSKNWTYDVRGAFNAFFSPSDGPNGASNAKLVLYLNPVVFEFDNVSITVQAQRSGRVIVIETDNDELYVHNVSGLHKWDLVVPVEAGVNTLIAVTLSENETLEMNESSYATGIAYYRALPPSSGGGSSTGGGSSGGSSWRPLDQEFELVYTVFADDVLESGDSQTLRLDARASEGDVTEVSATIRDPVGTETEYDLELVSGTGGYGTWETRIEPERSGQYDLISVSMIGESRDSDTFPVADRSFYLLGDSVEEYEVLVLVYTTLDATRIKPDGTFSFTLDARDSIGVTGVQVTFGAKNLTFTEPLELIEGSESYGTWRLTYAPTLNDTTYRITSVTLANAETEVSYPIENRAVYVEPAPNVRPPGGSPLTGQVTGFGIPTNSTEFIELLQRPFVPVVIGFIVFGLIVAIAAMVRSK